MSLAPPADDLVAGHGGPLDGLSGPALALLVGASYAALADQSLWIENHLSLGTVIWPAAGLAVAALLLVPVRRWGWVAGAVVVASAGVYLLRGVPPVSVPWWAAANATGPLVGAAVFRRIRGPDPAVHQLGGVIALIAATVIVGPLVGGVIASVGSVVDGNPAGLRLLAGHSGSVGLGVLTLTPVLLTWNRRSRRRAPLETLVISGVLLVAIAFSYWDATGGPDAGMPFFLAGPAIAWAALRYGVRGASLAFATFAYLANLATASGSGPFATDVALAAGGAGGRALGLQIFLLVLGVTVLEIAVLAEDLTERGEVERRLQYQADHDALTTLPNRAATRRWLDRELAGSGSSSERLVVLLADIDRFKRINDDHGQGIGDHVLLTVAERLRALAGDRGRAARWSGDQFLVAVPSTPDEVAVQDLGLRTVAAVETPIDAPGELAGRHRVAVRCSVGLVTSEPGEPPEALVARAEAALAAAKQGGGHALVVFDEPLRLQVEERSLLERDLVPAMGRGEIYCAYQPEIDLRSGELFGFEALARWRHPERGPVGPDRFVPIAEATGAAGLLFDTVLRRALETQSRWSTRLGFRPVVSVNLSARQLSDPELPATVATLLTRFAAPADGLWLEVTETALADDPALPVLRDLHELGVSLAIDDFGTGWSSMTRLSAFPWDALKIDRSFVSPLGIVPDAEHVVRATIDMAHALGMRTVAEGVETEVQLEHLTGLGCDIAQGYLLGRPMDPRDAIEGVTADGRWDLEAITWR